MGNGDELFVKSRTQCAEGEGFAPLLFFIVAARALPDFLRAGRRLAGGSHVAPRTSPALAAPCDLLPVELRIQGFFARRRGPSRPSRRLPRVRLST